MNKNTRKWYLFAALFAGLLSLPSVGQVIDNVGKIVTWYKPVASATWQIQLTGNINPNYQVSLYDIDMFDSSVSLIEQLHGVGKACYLLFFCGII